MYMYDISRPIKPLNNTSVEQGSRVGFCPRWAALGGRTPSTLTRRPPQHKKEKSEYFQYKNMATV